MAERVHPLRKEVPPPLSEPFLDICSRFAKTGWVYEISKMHKVKRKRLGLPEEASPTVEPEDLERLTSSLEILRKVVEGE